MNLVAEMSDAEGHHPDIILEYGQITVKWWSHKIQSLHEMILLWLQNVIWFRIV